MLRFRPIRFRFSLRSLLIAMTLFGVWGGYHANRGWRERQAVAALARDAQLKVFDMRAVQPRPTTVIGKAAAIYRWLVAAMWRDDPITHVGVGSRLEPEVIRSLGSLRNLKSLDVNSRGPSPEEFEATRGLAVFRDPVSLPPGSLQKAISSRAIEELGVGWYVLSDLDCAAIASNPRINRVVMSRCTLPANGLAAILVKPGLREITLMKCDVSGGLDDAGETPEGLLRVNALDTTLPAGIGKIIERSPTMRNATARQGSGSGTWTSPQWGR